MTISQVITTLPAAPDPATMTRDEFNTAAAAYVLAQKAMVPELNTWAGQVNAIAATAVGDVATAIGAAAADTPVDADTFCWRKTANGLLKSISWANIKALLSAGMTFTGLVNLAAGADIASAATVDLTAATGNTVNITGTTAISAFTMNDGQHMTFIAVGALPLTYHATTCKIAGGQSITAYAGQVFEVFKKGTVVTVMPQDPVAVFGGMQLTSTLNNIAATTYTKMVCSAGNAGNVGMTFTDANDEITITSGGAYDVTIAWRYSSSVDNTDGSVVLYKNGALASAGYQPVASNPVANRTANCSVTYTLPLAAGDVLALYAWSSNAANSFTASGNTYISIAKRGAYP